MTDHADRFDERHRRDHLPGMPGADEIRIHLTTVGNHGCLA